MYCTRCGNDLGEGQTCSQCGWSNSELELPTGQPAPAPSSTGEGPAVASLVIGIISWFVCFGFGFLPIIGLILGVLGLKSRQSGTAIAGIAINAATLILFVLIMLLIAIWMMVPQTSVSTGRCC